MWLDFLKFKKKLERGLRFLELVKLTLLDKPYKTWKLVIISRMVMRGNCLYNAQNFENERIICMGMIITVDGP